MSSLMDQLRIVLIVVVNQNKVLVTLKSLFCFFKTTAFKFNYIIIHIHSYVGSRILDFA